MGSLGVALPFPWGTVGTEYTEYGDGTMTNKKRGPAYYFVLSHVFFN